MLTIVCYTYISEKLYYKETCFLSNSERYHIRFELNTCRYPRTNVRGTLSEVICLSSGIHPRVDTRGPLRTVDRPAGMLQS